MEKLEALASVTRLSDRVVRVLGQNPGKFTLQGTNTYIIGQRNPYTLVDTGEGKEEYIPHLESALREASNPEEPHVSDIIISHWHGDHVNGLPSVLSLLRRLWDERNVPAPFKPPRIHKFPLAHTADGGLEVLRSKLSQDSYTAAPNGTLFHDLSDLQSFFVTGCTAPLKVLHTPGHTKDSICLYLPEDRALYTADTILGQGTAVFEDLASYISSLRKMLDFRSSDGHNTEYAALYPGHGPVVTEGPKLISTYIEHRTERENQIVHVMKQPPPEGQPWSTWGIVSTIYAAYPQNLWLPAANSVDQHLKKLQAEGKVRHLGGEGKDVKWELLAKL
ncbi:Metallo-hydrolase/oxidoreductase [Leucogyrophana mollusca]|uniref:Metallo-hydrolase/oxidoreductase n=1 Tax=Leucogyrophana mollusca TaxID=85980 RepID=A0ACB8BRY1_9AGAM|nr:Metallo-hydrolase/oxidoreductase [Leucogyrophana mollusca]